MKASSQNLAVNSGSFRGVTGWAAFRRGMAHAFPVALGYFPISVGFGLAACELGIPPWAAVLMSLTTYGGAAQMLALSLLALNQSLLTVLLAVFVINSRFFILSMAITERVRHWPPLRKILFGTYLSDEAFALLVSPPYLDRRRLRSMECLGLVSAPAIAWIAGTISGYVAAEHFAGIKQWGLEFALIALLLAVLASQLRDRYQCIVAVSAAAISIACNLGGFSSAAIVLAAVLTPFIGLALQRRSWRRKLRVASAAPVSAETEQNRREG